MATRTRTRVRTSNTNPSSNPDPNPYPYPYPYPTTQVGTQLFWTRETEAAFDCMQRGEPNALKEYSTKQVALLGDLIKLVQGELERLQRRKVMHPYTSLRWQLCTLLRTMRTMHTVHTMRTVRTLRAMLTR